MDHRTSKAVKNAMKSLPQDQEIPLLLELMSSTLDLDPGSLLNRKNKNQKNIRKCNQWLISGLKQQVQQIKTLTQKKKKKALKISS